MNRSAPFLDWLRFTLPYSIESFAWIRNNFDGGELRERGYLSYAVSESLLCGGLVAYDPNQPKKRILVELSASALSASLKTVNPQKFLAELVNISANVTRIDIALDDHEKLLRPSRIWRKLRKDHAIIQERSYSRIESHERGEEYSGDTVYIGSRTSDVFIRVYDKAGQTKTPGHWVRCEVEIKGDAAKEIASRIAHGTIDLRNWICRQVDFKEKPKTGKAKKKNWPRAKFWDDFLQPFDKERIYFPQYEIGLEEVEAWLVNQVSGALHLMKRTKGLETIEKEGKEKFLNSKRYMALKDKFLQEEKMRLTINKNPESYEVTVKEIFRMAKEYRNDVLEFPEMRGDVFDAYNYVRSLPYREDPKGIEFVTRPSQTLWKGWMGPRDCDDKTLALGAYAELNKILWRAVVCGASEKPEENPHHIYPEFQLNGIWVSMDGTYADEKCKFGGRLYEKEMFRKEYYPGKKF